MPNPKVGTVTQNVAKAVEEAKKGRVEFKVDKTGNLHVPIGKISFDNQKLIENAFEVIETVQKLRPSGLKGQYIKNMAMKTTMSPSVKLDIASVLKSLEAKAA